MHALGLARDLSFCVVDDQPILLDLRSDSYFTLAPAEAAALRQAASDEASGSQCLSLLRDAGILELAPRPTNIEPTRLRPPEASLLEGSALGRASASAAVRIALDLVWLKARLRLGGLAALVHALREAKAKASSTHGDRNREALDFVACRRWIPIAAGCLPDSLALAFHLARRGLSATLVVGVKLHPFAAHAWLQHDGIVLNDGLDGPLDFTPILVV